MEGFGQKRKKMTRRERGCKGRCKELFEQRGSPTGDAKKRCEGRKREAQSKPGKGGRRTSIGVGCVHNAPRGGGRNLARAEAEKPKAPRGKRKTERANIAQVGTHEAEECRARKEHGVIDAALRKKADQQGR